MVQNRVKKMLRKGALFCMLMRDLDLIIHRQAAADGIFHFFFYRQVKRMVLLGFHRFPVGEFRVKDHMVSAVR